MTDRNFKSSCCDVPSHIKARPVDALRHTNKSPAISKDAEMKALEVKFDSIKMAVGVPKIQAKGYLALSKFADMLHGCHHRTSIN